MRMDTWVFIKLCNIVSCWNTASKIILWANWKYFCTYISSNHTVLPKRLKITCECMLSSFKGTVEIGNSCIGWVKSFFVLFFFLMFVLKEQQDHISKFNIMPVWMIERSTAFVPALEQILSHEDLPAWLKHIFVAAAAHYAHRKCPGRTKPDWAYSREEFGQSKR